MCDSERLEHLKPQPPLAMNVIMPGKLNSPAFCTSWPLCILRYTQETSTLSMALAFGKNIDYKIGHYIIDSVMYRGKEQVSKEGEK